MIKNFDFDLLLLFNIDELFETLICSILGIRKTLSMTARNNIVYWKSFLYLFLAPIFEFIKH